MITWLIFLAHNCNMMISSIHCRTHKVYRTCIYTDVFFVCMFLMNCFCNKASIRSHHETPKFRIDSNISHSCRNKNLFVYFTNALSNHTNVIRCLVRSVWNTDSTGKVNKSDMCSCFFLKLYCKFKHDFGEHRIIFIRYCIAGKKCMNTEILCSFCFQSAKCFKNLLRCHSIFSISRVIHNIIADFKDSAWIITATDRLRNISDRFFNCFNMSNIIQIDNATDFICITEFCFWCIIRRKHDITFFAADCFGQHQFCHRRTVTSTAIFLKNLNQIRIRSCFYCKKFFKSFIPCKSFFQCFCIFANSFFVIKMKRCRIFFSDFLKLFQSYKRLFFHIFISSLYWHYFTCWCVNR